jgi:hypothetical protein
MQKITFWLKTHRRFQINQYLSSKMLNLQRTNRMTLKSYDYRLPKCRYMTRSTSVKGVYLQVLQFFQSGQLEGR